MGLGMPPGGGGRLGPGVGAGAAAELVVSVEIGPIAAEAVGTTPGAELALSGEEYPCWPGTAGEEVW